MPQPSQISRGSLVRLKDQTKYGGCWTGTMSVLELVRSDYRGVRAKHHGDGSIGTFYYDELEVVERESPFMVIGDSKVLFRGNTLEECTAKIEQNVFMGTTFSIVKLVETMVKEIVVVSSFTWRRDNAQAG